MKTKQFLPALLALALTAGLGCSKKSDDAAPTVKDCEKNNYSVFTVTYGSSAVRHSVIVTFNNKGQFHEKISAIGLSSDTLHIRPGTFPVSISSINSSSQAITSTNRTVTFAQCTDALASVTY